MIKRLPDPGLGEKFFQGKGRMVNKDGTFNSKRIGLNMHLYHYLISVNPFKISFIIVGAYLISNLFFTWIYILVGTENLGTLPVENKFVTAFLFSMQTFTTVGFGALYPHDYITGLISGMEAMFGLLFFAFATGIVYGRFSKPTTSIRFSESAIIAPYKETGRAFMFRIVNARPNTLIEMSVRIILALKTIENDSTHRQYYNLDLETASVVFFPLPWTIVHSINNESPLSGLTKQEYEKMDAEFLIHVKGFDETYAQVTNTIYSYKHYEIEWGARFKRNYILTDDGSIVYDINVIGETEKAELP
jgi:inward rectifier potassium channel